MLLHEYVSDVWKWAVHSMSFYDPVVIVDNLSRHAGGGGGGGGFQCH